MNGESETVAAGDVAPTGFNAGDNIDGWVGWNLYGGQAWQADDTVEGSGYFGGSLQPRSGPATPVTTPVLLSTLTCP